MTRASKFMITVVFIGKLIMASKKNYYKNVLTGKYVHPILKRIT